MKLKVYIKEINFKEKEVMSHQLVLPAKESDVSERVGFDVSMRPLTVVEDNLGILMANTMMLDELNRIAIMVEDAPERMLKHLYKIADQWYSSLLAALEGISSNEIGIYDGSFSQMAFGFINDKQSDYYVSPNMHNFIDGDAFVKSLESKQKFLEIEYAIYHKKKHS